MFSTRHIALILAVCSATAIPATAQAARPYHSCKKTLSYEVSLKTNLECAYTKLLVEDIAHQVASRWPVKVFYLWDHGTDTAGHPKQYRYTCHASQELRTNGPGGDSYEVQHFRCTKVNGQGFKLVTEIE